MSLFYGRNTSVSSALSKYSYIPTQSEERNGAVLRREEREPPRTAPQLLVALGNITKSHPIHTVQGFRRIRNFALQHQAGIILGKKSRVCGCGKRKINKDLPRGVVYNENSKAHINNVQYCGSVWVCAECARKNY